MSKQAVLDALENLPRDPRLAFTGLCDVLGQYDFSNTQSDFDLFVLELLVAFSRRYEISLPERDEDTSDSGYIRNVLSFGYRLSVQNQIDAALDRYEEKFEDKNFGFAVLSDIERKTIRSQLESIRNIIVSSSLNDSKKEALLKRIHKLEKEIELEKTPTERFFGFLADLALVSGDLARNAKPAIDEFKDILQIIMRSRAKAEGTKLPTPENWPQLPTPEDMGQT